ncbi:MAG: ATP-binding protein [Candidatus Hodarchaeota archaeon]
MEKIGSITAASLSGGFKMRFIGEASPEALRLGQYLVIQGKVFRFLCMISDISLSASQDQLTNLLVSQGFRGEQEVQSVLPTLLGRSLFVETDLQPLKMIRHISENKTEIMDPKTIPPHLSEVRRAHEADVADVFGKIDGETLWPLGQPIGMDFTIPINVDRFLARSSGIFAISGAGKSFLAKILIGAIIGSKKGCVFVFDMHDEYGNYAIDEKKGTKTPGIKALFPDQTTLFTLDPSTFEKYDAVLVIGTEDISINDLLALSNQIHLTDAQEGMLYQLKRGLGEGWLATLLNPDLLVSREEMEQISEDTNVPMDSLRSIVRKFYFSLGRFKFIKPGKHAKKGIQKILGALSKGTSVVLNFGKYKDDLSAYMLVSNLITRRIRDEYVENINKRRQNPSLPEFPNLLIFIEEAHKFLDKQAAKWSVFNKIAREMRKYKVALCIIDQRPSTIDPDVMSQIWSRFIMTLADTRDIDAVLSGMKNASNMKTVVYSLEQQEALCFGFAFPMPSTIRVVDFNPSLFGMWKSPLGESITKTDESSKSPEDLLAEINADL